jgi:hypothetical protein
MKYSLRSLMIVVTLVCVVVGGRIEYLRRMSAFHNLEEKTQLSRLAEVGIEMPKGIKIFVAREGLDSDFDFACDKILYHRQMQQRFDDAVFHPWILVDESPVP